jgi:hypothetical protein
MESDLHKISTSYNWESIPTGRETEGNASKYEKEEAANVGISAHRRMRHSMFLWVLMPVFGATVTT